jgi:hypothetical protein
MTLIRAPIHTASGDFSPESYADLYKIPTSRLSEGVQGARNAFPASIEDMRVDHRRLHTGMAQQLRAALWRWRGPASWHRIPENWCAGRVQGHPSQSQPRWLRCSLRLLLQYGVYSREHCLATESTRHNQAAPHARIVSPGGGSLLPRSLPQRYSIVQSKLQSTP